jgi:peptidyl-prolyl cis-trans isomerase B (cyclophilin B)
MSLQDYLSDIYEVDMGQESIDEFLFYGGAPWLYGRHTIFAQVYKGFEVLDAIADAAVDTGNYRPLEDIVIESVRIVNSE